MTRRTHLLRLIIAAIFAGLLLRLAQLQLVQGGDLRRASEENRIRVVARRAPRGVMYDCRGRVLASNRPSFSATLIPSRLPGDDAPAVLRRLSRVLDIPVADLTTTYRNGKGQGSVVLKQDLSPDAVAQLEEQALHLPGLLLTTNPVRFYPSGSLAAHALGYVREVTREDLARLSSASTDHAGAYRAGDSIGKEGIERMCERYLRGRDGGEQIEVDATGRVVRVLGTVNPTPGRNIRLTIDRPVQAAAERGLAGHAGAVVALDPATGAIRALASSPSFDPNIFARPLTPAQWARLNSPGRPQNNRALTGRYEPGSTFKIITAIAALEKGVVTPHSPFYCPGYLRLGGWTFRCWTTHRALDFIDGIAQSCNYMFMTLGRRVGPDTLAATARRFGLGASTGVDLPRESRGLVPTPAWKREKRRQPWFPGDTCQMAMGQGDLLVTPLQVARMVAAVANGGELVTPHLIAHIDGLPPAEQPRHPVRSLPVEDEVLAVVREGMAAVVSRGTARSIYSSKLPIAGKTGTAQNPHGSPHAWFAGFAPANNPQLVVVVLMEQGGHGGAVSAPIAKRVFEAALLPPASPAR